MDNLFLIIFLLSFVLLIFGLVKPASVIRWGDPEKRNRKKVLKTYLSIALIAFIGFGMTTDTSKNQQTQQATAQQAQLNQSKPAEQPTVKSYKPGQYKVGTDLPAGEYVAIAKSLAYIEVSNDASGALTSIVANDNFMNRSIITAKDGQFLKIQGGELYSAKDVQKPQPKDGYLPAGMYKVGTDFPAGEYKVTSEGGDSYIEVSSSSTHSMGDIISNDIFQGDRYIKVSDGQYLKIFRAKIKVN